MIKIYVYYMEPLTIGIIVCIIIAIIVAVFFITRPPVESSLLDKTLKAFNIGIESKLGENFTSGEHFISSDEFKTEADIKNNFMVFLGYLFPKMNVDKINKLLKEYGSDKTMQEIVTENKDKNTINNFLDNFLSQGLGKYNGYLYDETNDKKIIENLYVFTTVFYAFLIIYTNTDLNSIIKTLPNEYKNIEYIKMNFSDDYKETNMIDLYIRTNYNKDIKLENAISFDEIDAKYCYTTRLCKKSANIQEYVNSQKAYNQANIETLKTLFDLSLVLYLLKLSGVTTLDKINTDLDSLSKTLPKNNSEFNSNSNAYSKKADEIRDTRTAIFQNYVGDISKIKFELDNFDTAASALLDAINANTPDIMELNTAYETATTALQAKVTSLSPK